MTWWRRNRLGLALLPLAAVLAVLASSSRVVMFWWPYGPHEVTTVPLGTATHLSQPWQDKGGKHVREVSVTIDGVRRTSTVLAEGKEAKATLPKGSQLWRVTMTLAADPSQVLRGCRLEIVDTVGREYAFGSTLIDTRGVLKTHPCLNEGQAGPEMVLYKGQSTEITEPRPPTWSTSADLLLPDDATPALVRIYWVHPQVIEVPVTGHTD